MKILDCNIISTRSYGFTAHRHPKASEVHFFFNGEGTFHADGQAFPFTGPSFFFTPPMVPHHMSMVPREHPLSFYFVTFIFEGVDADLQQSLCSRFAEKPFISSGMSTRFALEDVRRKWEGDHDGNYKAMVHRFMAFLWEAAEASEPRYSPAPVKHIDKIISHLQDSIHRPLSLAQLSADTGLDRSYIVRLCTKHLAVSPMRYLTKLKMDTAVYLLEETDLSVKQIARDLAFSDPFYFSRVFKQYQGVSPALFRERGAASRRLHDSRDQLA